MLPSTGYFKGFTCPFYESGLCERPHCHFRHVRRDPEISNDTIANTDMLKKLVSETVKKVLLQSDKNASDIESKSQNIITQVVEELNPTTSVLSNEKPVTKVTYNPTPIAELNKMISVPSSETLRPISKNVTRKHIPVPYTPHRPSRSQLLRMPVKLDSGTALTLTYQAACTVNSTVIDKYTPSAVESESSIKYLPGSLGDNPTPYSPAGQATSGNVSYTPSDLSKMSDVTKVSGYFPTGQSTSGVSYKPGVMQPSSGSSYCPKNNSALNQTETKPFTYVPKFNYKPTPLTKPPSPTFSSDEDDEPSAKKVKFSESEELEDLEMEFEMLGEILEDENNTVKKSLDPLTNKANSQTLTNKYDKQEKKTANENDFDKLLSNNDDKAFSAPSIKHSKPDSSKISDSSVKSSSHSDIKRSSKSSHEHKSSRSDHKHSTKKKREDVVKEKDISIMTAAKDDTNKIRNSSSRDKEDLSKDKLCKNEKDTSSKDKPYKNKEQLSKDKDRSSKDKVRSSIDKDRSLKDKDKFLKDKDQSSKDKDRSSKDKSRSSIEKDKERSSKDKDRSSKDKDRTSKDSESTSKVKSNESSNDSKKKDLTKTSSSHHSDSKSKSTSQKCTDHDNKSKSSVSNNSSDRKSKSSTSKSASSKHDAKSEKQRSETKDKSHRTSHSTSKHSSKEKSTSKSNKSNSHSTDKNIKEIDLFSYSLSDSSNKASDSDSIDCDVIEILSDSDEESITQECMKIFEEYVPAVKESSNVDCIKQANVEDTQSIGKKRVAHNTNTTIYRTPNTALPNHKTKAVQMVTDRYSAVKQFHNERLNAMTSSIEHTTPVVRHEPSPSNTTSCSKVRIAHVPYASSLFTAKKALPIPDPPKATPTQTIAKGSNRVAHVPNEKFSDRPTPLEPLASKVPINIRLKYLHMMIDDCLKIYLTVEDAYKRALHEELATNKRCTTVTIYKNSALLAVSRLRKEIIQAGGQKITNGDKISHSKMMLGKKGETVSWSIENKYKKDYSNISNELKGSKFYENIHKWILSEEELRDNGFPRPHPDKKEKGCAKIYTQNTRQKPPKGFTRCCSRCKKEYDVDKKGFAIRIEECIYHPKNKYRFRGEVKYQCCSQDATSDGCLSASTHVFEYVDHDNLRGFVTTLPKEDESFHHGVYALDCEMCYTTNGLDLTRVTVINTDLKVVFESLVKPLYPIIDYNTNFSGITEDHMRNVTTSLLEVQATLLHMFSDKTILVGHSLESDFKALKLIHNTVVDTSVLFPHKMGPPYKRALRNLCSEYIKKIIQNSVDGHDSAEDALVCMELLMWKVKEELKTK